MINNEKLQAELEKEQAATTEVNTLSAALLLALSQGVNEMFRMYGVDGIVTLRQMNQRGRKKRFFQSLFDSITAHYKRVRDLVNTKMTDGYKSAYKRYMAVYEKELDLPLDKELPEKVVQSAIKEGHPLNKTVKYNRDKTMQQMRKEFEESWKRQEPQDKVVKRVEKVVSFDNKRVINVSEHYTASMQSRAQVQSIEEADKQGVEAQIFWVSYRDERVRMSHRDLHHNSPDENGWFHIGGDRAKAPRMFVRPENSINCRCYLSVIGVNVKDDKLWKELNSAESSAARRKIWEERERRIS